MRANLLGLSVLCGLFRAGATFAADGQQTFIPCDIDGDGFQGPQCGGPDCNDNVASINPGAPEVPADGIDQDCNGGDVCYLDVDNDNFGTSLVASADLDCADLNEGALPGDCNDSNAAIHPGATEIPGDSIDEDCNGGELCYTDVDNDNYGTNPLINSADVDCFDLNEGGQPGDCNDSNASIHPGAFEVPGDSIDEDCNGTEVCYQDSDNDDYGTNSTVISSDIDCFDAFEATNTGDCDDTNASVHPGAIEVCDNLDNDCNTAVDEGFVAPSGVPTLTLAKAGGTVAQLNWTVVGLSTGGDAIFGNLNTLLSSGGDFTSSTISCFANDTTSPSTTLAGDPSTGSGLWFLVRPVNCHTPGSYDTASPKQLGSRNAEIAASGAPCP